MTLTERDTQPVGPDVRRWTTRSAPQNNPIEGRHARVERLDPERHARDLYEANAGDTDGRNWTYLFDEKPATSEAYRAWAEKAASTSDPFFHAIIDLATGRACGVAALMRIDRANGVIEVGHINFSPRLQRTRAATESIFLLMRRAFDELGYRRFEWKCDSLNAPSRAAALRFGFSFEGIFRQAVIYKGRSRDTAWYSIIDKEWPAVKAAFERWLDPANFRADGGQCRRLRDFRSEG